MSLGWVLVLGMVAAGEPPGTSEPYRPGVDRDGIATLPAEAARLDGERLRLDGSAEPPLVAGWTSTRESVAWEFVAPRAGWYQVVVEYGVPQGQGGATYRVEVAGQVRQAKAHATGAARRLLPQPMKDAVKLPEGVSRLVVRGLDAPHGLVLYLARIRLVPAEPGPDDEPNP